MIFSRSYRIRFGDIDDAGIAYYPTLFHAFHCCMEDWWADALGTPYPTLLHEHGFGLPTVHIEADFMAPVRYGDEPELCLGVLAVGRGSVEFGFWMQRGERALCRARITTAGIDMKTMRATPVPERWRTAFADWAISVDDLPPARGA